MQEKTGNQKGHLHVFNMSTGKGFKVCSLYIKVLCGLDCVVNKEIKLHVCFSTNEKQTTFVALLKSLYETVYCFQ